MRFASKTTRHTGTASNGNAASTLWSDPSASTTSSGSAERLAVPSERRPPSVAPQVARRRAGHAHLPRVREDQVAHAVSAERSAEPPAAALAQRLPLVKGRAVEVDDVRVRQRRDLGDPRHLLLAFGAPRIGGRAAPIPGRVGEVDAVKGERRTVAGGRARRGVDAAHGPVPLVPSLQPSVHRRHRLVK